MDEFIKKLMAGVEASDSKIEFALSGCNVNEFIQVKAVKRIINELAEEYNNGFCKWELKQDMFVKNPHTRRMFSCEPSMKNIYCCTCGKKIKVISAEQPDSISEAWKQRTMSRFERVE